MNAFLMEYLAYKKLSNSSPVCITLKTRDSLEFHLMLSRNGTDCRPQSHLAKGLLERTVYPKNRGFEQQRLEPTLVLTTK